MARVYFYRNEVAQFGEWKGTKLDTPERATDYLTWMYHRGLITTNEFRQALAVVRQEFGEEDQEVDSPDPELEHMIAHYRIPNYVLQLDNSALWKRWANRLFLAWLRRCFNYEGFEMKARGRHSDRRQAFVDHDHVPNSCRDVPVRFAEKLVIYIHRKKEFSRVVELEGGVSVRFTWREDTQYSLPDS